MSDRKPPPLVIALGRPYTTNLRGQLVRLSCSLEGCGRKALKRLWIMDENGQDRMVWAFCRQHLDTERATNFTVHAFTMYVRSQDLDLSPWDLFRLYWSAPKGQRAESLHQVLFGGKP